MLSTLPIFSMTVLKLPQKFIKLLDRVRRRFIWGVEENETAGGKCKISWSKVCSPTEHGGLGILDLNRFARALRLRWQWMQWQQPRRPWAGMETPCDTQDLDLFAAATTVTLGDGSTASFWYSNWIGSSPLRLRFPELFTASRRKGRTVAAALDGNRWVLDLSHIAATPLIRSFVTLWREIQRAEIHLQEGTRDTICWSLTDSQCYTARSAYRMQFEGRIRSPIRELVWTVWAPAKCKLFSWLLLQNRLWCADRLLRRGWPNPYFCALCSRNLETASHLFLECPVSNSIWTSVSSWPGCAGLLPTTWAGCTGIAEAWQAAIEATAPQGRHAIKSLLILTCWIIWKERNGRIFNQRRSSVPQLVQTIRDEAREWAFMGAKKLRKLLWEPP